MLAPGTFMQRVAFQPYANHNTAVPDWRKPNNSRVTLTTTRLPSRVRAIVHQAE